MVMASKWRVKTDTVMNHGRNCVVSAGIELFGERGGANLVPIQSGYSSQLIYGNDGYDNAWHAFDGDITSIWHDSCTLGGVDYIGWDFGTPTEVVGFSWRARTSGYFNEDSIETGGLEYYDDVTSAWVRLFDIETQVDWLNNERRAFFDPASAVPDADGFRFWEVLGIAGGEGGLGYDGMSGAAMYREPASDNLIDPSYLKALHGPGLQGGSSDSILTPPGLVQWNGNADGINTWFAYDFGENNLKKVQHVLLYPNNDSPTRSWTEFEIAGYNNADRSDRTVLAHFTGVTWVAHTTQYFDIPPYGYIPPVEMVGTASATSSAVGLAPTGRVDGLATATSTANAASFALGTISTTGTSFALGTAAGAVDPVRPAVGAAAGTSSATGAGSALGTLEMVGSSSAAGTADSGSRATGIISADGGAAGVGAALGIGSVLVPTVGTAAATSLADAGGAYKPTEAFGRAAGTGTAIARVSQIVALVGTASAGSYAEAPITRMRTSVGLAAGQGSVQGISNVTPDAVGSASAIAGAIGVGTGIASAIGSGASSSNALGVGVAFSPAFGLAHAVSPVAGVAVTVRQARGLAYCAGDAHGSSAGIVSAAGAAHGSSTSAASATGLAGARGWATGFSLVEAVGKSAFVAVGRSAGASLAIAYTQRLVLPADAADILPVPVDQRLLQVAPPENTVLVVAVDDPIMVVPADRGAAIAA